MTHFFLTVVNMSISASWIVLAVLLLRVLLKKAPKWITVLIWGIVGVRLICPFSIESTMSLIPSAETIRPEIMMEAAPTIDSGIPVINDAVNPVISQSFAPNPENSANPLQMILPALALVWIVGIAVMLGYTAFSYLRLRRKIGTAIVLRDNIFQSENVVSPFVLGVIRPEIFLPFHIQEQDMQYVIAHENAHIRRKDHLWKPVGYLILTLHWFNPLMWLGYVLLCRDIELACDEKVIKELDTDAKADYSQALLTCSVNRRMIAACPLAFGETSVKGRVKSVLSYKKPAFWIIVVAVLISIAAAVCFLTNPVDSDKKGLSAVEWTPVFVNDKWGYIDKTGQYVIEPQFDNAHHFAENGLAMVTVNGKCGYIDQSGNFVIAPQFDLAYDFTGNGLAVAKEKNKWGFIDKSGQWVIEPRFVEACDFSDNGLAAVRVSENYKYGFVDESGRFVIEPQFDWAYSFTKDGLAEVWINEKYGYIDQHGQYVVEPRFDYIGSFAPNGLASVWLNDKCGFVDKRGQYVIEPLFDDVGSFAKNGLAAACLKDKYGFIDKSGQWVIEPRFDEAWKFSDNGLAVVKANGKYGYIDESGKYIVVPRFELAQSFRDGGLAVVKDNDKYGYMDETGKIAIELQFDYAWDFTENGLAMVLVNKQCGYIDKSGNYLVSPYETPPQDETQAD